MSRGEASIAAMTTSYHGFTSSAGSWPIWFIQPDEFIATDDTVVALGHESARVMATGWTYHSDFAFVFQVRNGKLTAGATHEGFWSYLQKPNVNLTTIRSLIFQAANLSPSSGFSWK